MVCRYLICLGNMINSSKKSLAGQFFFFEPWMQWYLFLKQWSFSCNMVTVTFQYNIIFQTLHSSLQEEMPVADKQQINIDINNHTCFFRPDCNQNCFFCMLYFCLFHDWQSKIVFWTIIYGQDVPSSQWILAVVASMNIKSVNTCKTAQQSFTWWLLPQKPKMQFT